MSEISFALNSLGLCEEWFGELKEFSFWAPVFLGSTGAGQRFLRLWVCVLIVGRLEGGLKSNFCKPKFHRGTAEFVDNRHRFFICELQGVDKF